MNYCKFCMSEIESGTTVCPVCGRDLTAEQPLHHLKPGTVLSDRYVVGAALGEGGFGITYIGINTRLDMKVAVKEYFPLGFVHRTSSVSQTVTSRTANSEDAVFEKGRERFLAEAKTLAKFSDEPGVVSVHDFFEENNTAYIVMEYLEGQTLKDHLKKKGRLSYGETLSLLMPVMQSLSNVHEKGLIHRDISPDNIMLTGKSVKLLDFGSARYADGEKSLSVMLKHGYAPIEQYKRKGEQGPWTDVYALSATIYKCITGATPDEATDRVLGDGLKKPSEYGAEISPECEAALMKGLAVNPNDRYRTVNDLIKGLTGKDDSLVIAAKPEKEETPVIPVVPVPDKDKTVLGNAGPDPDKTVFEDDPDKTVFTNKPEYPVKPKPAPVYKEKTDEPKEKQSKKALKIALVASMIVLLIICTVATVLYIKGNVHTHTYSEWTVIKQATCTEDGEEERICTGCGEKETRTTEATGHTIVTDKAVSATCLIVGKTEGSHCSICGTVIKAQSTIAALGHSYGSYQQTKVPTCTETGTEIGTCSRCGNTESRTVAALGHSYGSYQQTKAPTCTETGTEQRTCSRCGDTETRTVTALGHNYGNSNQCSRCGELELKYFNFTLNNDTYEVKAKDRNVIPSKIVIPSTYNGKPVTSIGRYAFEGCSGLTSITIPDSITIIGGKSFYGCSNLTSITIPDSVTWISNYAFTHCSGLTSITIPDSVTTIGEGAFSGCSGLTKIEVAKGNTAYHSAGNCIIETESKTLILGCKNSEIPTDGSVTSIGVYAFSRCTGLTNITIPDSVTRIGNYAFYYCSGLKSITIPDSVTSISECAFKGCNNLASITYKGTKVQWSAISKGMNWNYDTGNYTVHCTDGDISKN